MEQFIDKDNTGTSTFEVRSSTKFAMVPRWIIRDPTLSHGAVRLYGVIMSYADNTDRAAFPSRKTIATDMGVSDRSITRFIKELEDRKILTVERRRNKRTGNFYANHYVLQFDEVAETNQKPPEDTSGTRRVDKIAPLTKPTNITRPTSFDAVDEIDARIALPPISDEIDAHTTDEHGFTPEGKQRIINMILSIYAQGSWEDVEAITTAIEEETGIDASDAVVNYRWDERLWEIVGREGHSARYNAGTWLSMMLNWHDMHGC